MAAIFSDKYLFLGGDELPLRCFDESPTIAAWMKVRGLNSSSTQQYFWQQMTAQVFPHLNKTISVWRADSPILGAFASNLPAGSVPSCTHTHTHTRARAHIITSSPRA